MIFELKLLFVPLSQLFISRTENLNYLGSVIYIHSVENAEITLLKVKGFAYIQTPDEISITKIIMLSLLGDEQGVEKRRLFGQLL